MRKTIQKKYNRIKEALQHFLKRTKKQQPQFVLQPIPNHKNIL
jgi:hypothetical protein